MGVSLGDQPFSANFFSFLTSHVANCNFSLFTINNSFSANFTLNHLQNLNNLFKELDIFSLLLTFELDKAASQLEVKVIVSLAERQTWLNLPLSPK